jgi:hypothetical protein
MTDHDVHHGHHPPHAAGQHEGTHTGDAHDVHGMIIVGGETVYLSHLPMFGHPHHDIQAILEATFAGEGGDPRSVYVDDRERTGTRMYTLRPEPFVLSEFLSGFGPSGTEQPPSARRTFRGDIVRGHFERGGRRILEGVVVEVTNVVHSRQFDPRSRGLAQLEYLLFGKGRELFLAHLITRPPDFDQILSVRVTGHEFTDDELRHGIRVVLPGRANSVPERVREGEQAVAEARLAGEETPKALEIQIRAGTEFYFEEGELRSRPTFDPTEEEIAAGFG